tara:strand:+ start:1691 stop:2173 length:483 start_codon:yes stop_codon:yes gene_type:complete
VKEPIKVEIELVHEDSHPLHRSTKNAAGYDIYSVVDEVIPPLGWKTIDTGIKIKNMPDWVEAQVRTRSGMASKHGVFVLNSPGTIDPDYKGEIKVILMNMGHLPYDIVTGDRIAQIVFNQHVTPELNAVVINHNIRGEKGLGSTGTKNNLLSDVPIGGRW